MHISVHPSVHPTIHLNNNTHDNNAPKEQYTQQHTNAQVQDMFLSPEHNWGVTVQCPTPFHLLALCAVLNTRYDSVTAGLPHLHVEGTRGWGDKVVVAQ